VKYEFKLKLKLYFNRQSVGQSVLVSGTHLGPVTNFFFQHGIFFRQLWVCYFVVPSLTRGRVYNLLLLLVLASAALLGSKFRRTQDHILLSQFLRLLQPGGPGPHIYIPRALGSLYVASYDSQGYGEDIQSNFHTGMKYEQRSCLFIYLIICSLFNLYCMYIT
jgi:hypothetical protein